MPEDASGPPATYLFIWNERWCLSPGPQLAPVARLLPQLRTRCSRWGLPPPNERHSPGPTWSPGFPGPENTPETGAISGPMTGESGSSYSTKGGMSGRLLMFRRKRRRTGARTLPRTPAGDDRGHWRRPSPGDVRIMKRVTTDALTSAGISPKAIPSSRRDLRGRGAGRVRHRSDAGQLGRARIPAGLPGCESPGIGPGPSAA